MSRKKHWLLALSILCLFGLAFWGARLLATAGGGADEPGRMLTLLAISLGTLVSEDLASISAGLLAASGRLDYLSAVLASFAGIFIGDILIYGMGYFFGRPLLQHRWARWFISESAVDRAQALFKKHGLWIIILTRFIPGTRSATYFAGGALHSPFGLFVGAFALAAAVWTPFLVGLSYFVGGRLLEFYDVYEAFTLPALLAAGLLLYVVLHYGIPLFTWKGRRRLKGKWIRAIRWEYWPAWQVNWLVMLYVLYLGLIRYRRPLLFTTVNPSMPHGGFIGESKSAILESLKTDEESIPKWGLIEPGELEERLEQFAVRMEALELAYPVVLKPDEGQRGLGVKIAHGIEEVRTWLESVQTPAILMEFVAGIEYGIFYTRMPSSKSGEIISITIKEQIRVIGNGRDSLDTLIHAHPRAIVLLGMFLVRFEAELDRVPEAGEIVSLGDLGTHSRGAIFMDGEHLLTPELTARVDLLSKACDGFYFGRFDIIVPNEASLQAGDSLKVIELNGLTSESTHIYDARHGLFHAWGVLCRQWKIAFEIAHENRLNGHEPTPFRQFVKEIFSAMRRQRELI